MAVMTMEDLKKHIEAEVLPILRTEVGKSVAELIQASLAKALEPVAKEQHDWMSKILGRQEAEAPRKREKGELAGFVIRCAAASAMSAKSGRLAAPEDIAKGWGFPDIARTIIEAREKALAAGDPLAGGTLIPQQFSQDYIDMLRPLSVVRRMGATSLPMPVGSIKIPKITSGMTAYYVGENTNITKSQLATGQVSLVWKKLAGLTPVSNDLLRYSSPGADAIVRDDAVRATAQAENSAFLRSQGVAGEPKGLRYQAAAANIVGAAATSLANVTTDLGKLIQKLMDNNIPFTRPAWIMAPRSYVYLSTVQTTTGQFAFRDELMQGKLWGYPFGVNTGIPCNLTDGGNTDETEVYLCDFADVVIGESLNVMVDASSEAAYYDGATVQASFSLDQTVVRVITEHDLAVRRAESVALLNKVRWGA